MPPFLNSVGLSAYAQNVSYDEHLYEEAMKSLGDGEYVVEAWVHGNLFFVDWDMLDEGSASNSLRQESDYSSFNECFETSLADQIEEWIEGNYPEKPKLGPVPPIDNSNSNFGRGLVLFMVVAGLVAALAIAPIAALAVIPGILLFWGYSKVERTTPEQQLARHKQEHQERVNRWAYNRNAFAESLRSRYRRKLAREIGQVLGVPERLWDEFASWFLRNAEGTRYELESDLQYWMSQPTFPTAPPSVPEGISHEEYENYCEQVLHSWGYLDATTTRYVQDGGIDVESSELVVQCKHVKGNVGSPDVQKIFGIASKDQKTAVVFSAGGFTKEGLTWGSEAGVALFVLKEIDGVAVPRNDAAKSVMARKTSTN